jgi:hypothetical protein
MDYFLCETNVNEYELVNVKGENILGEKIQEARHLNSNYISYKDMNNISHIYNLKTKKIIKTFDKDISVLNYHINDIVYLMYKMDGYNFNYKLYNYLTDTFSDEYSYISCVTKNDKYSTFIKKDNKSGLLSNDTFEEIIKVDGESNYTVLTLKEDDLVIEYQKDIISLYKINTLNKVKKIYKTTKYLNVKILDNYIVLHEDDDYLVIDIEGNILIQKDLFSDMRYIEDNKFCVKNKHGKKEYYFIELKIVNNNTCNINVISNQYKHVTPLSGSFDCNEDKNIDNKYFHVSKKNELISMANGIIDKNGDPVTDLKYLNVWFFTSEEPEE